MGILEQLQNQETYELMSYGDKLLGTLIVIGLGMLITFVVLILILFLTKLMSFAIQHIEKPKVSQPIESVQKQPVATTQSLQNEENDEELIAVITAAIAASLNTSMHNIVVSQIRRVPDTTPVWGKSGRSEVMTARK